VRVYRARFTRFAAIEGDRAAGGREGEGRGQEPLNGEAEGPGDRRYRPSPRPPPIRTRVDTRIRHTQAARTPIGHRDRR